MKQRYVVVLADSDGNVLEPKSAIAGKVNALLTSKTTRKPKMQLPKLPAGTQDRMSEITGNGSSATQTNATEDESVNWAEGGAAGAALGATVGSVVPGLGTVVGGAVGGTIGIVASLFT